MPELPDIAAYLQALGARILDQPLERVRLASPFVLRSVDPPVTAFEGRRVLRLQRLGKRIVWEFDDDLYLVIHLMIAGRLKWCARGAAISGRAALAGFDFPAGTLVLTEAGSKKRASITAVRGRDALAQLDPGGLEPLEADLAAFTARMRSERHTLKRALTDPHVVSGIGNAYSDEILHAARLSPFQLAYRLTDEEAAALYHATRSVLAAWMDRLVAEAAGHFPEKVTAFRKDMAVHGRYGEPCPRCGAPVQRISYAENECNYCAVCQTGGRLLADRALSRLLRDDWPRSLAELEERKRRQTR